MPSHVLPYLLALRGVSAKTVSHAFSQRIIEAQPSWGHRRRGWGHPLLTDVECRKAKPRERAYKLADAGGLYLFVTPTGFKSWRWKYRTAAGAEKRLTFGAYPQVSLTAARARRDEARVTLAGGADPAIDRKQKAAAARVAALTTLEAVARDWHDRNVERWVPRHAADVLRSLERDVFPTLGRLPLASITVPQVLDVVRAIEQRGSRETARRVRQRIEEIYAAAIGAGLARENPAAAIGPATLAPLVKGRQPALLTLAAARALLQAAEAAPGQPGVKLASRLLALTAVRPGVVRLAEPAEFMDLDGPDRRWRIPAAKMKGGQEDKRDDSFDFTVPLSLQAAAVVKVALRLIGRAPVLFPNTRRVDRPMSENAIGYMYNRLPGMRGRHVPHGWRATFSTIMNERAMAAERPGDRVVIDLMLAHVQDGVEARYNRAAYMARRRELAQEWADLLLDGLPPPEGLLAGPRC